MFTHVLCQTFPSETAHHTPSHRLRLAEPRSRSLTCCAWYGCPQLRGSLLPPPGTVRGGRLPCHQSSVVNHVLWPLLCVARKTSSLEPLPQRSVPQTAIYTFRRLCSALFPAIAHCGPLRVRSSSVFSRSFPRCVLPQYGFLLRASGVRTLAEALRSCALVPAAVPAAAGLCSALCLVVSGHLSTQTCLGGACRCGASLLLLRACCTFQCRVRPLLCASELLAPSCSKRSCCKEPFSRVVSQSCAPCLFDALVRLSPIFPPLWARWRST